MPRIRRAGRSIFADTGRLGSCQQALAPAAEPLDIDTVAFDEVVAGAAPLTSHARDTLRPGAYALSKL